MGVADTNHTMLAAYDQLVEDGALSTDAEQRAVALKLDDLAKLLVTAKTAKPSLGGMLGFRKTFPPTAGIKGLYIWGDVGRGKTLLMDLFFEQVKFEQKRRVHFHAFMGELHQLIGEFRQDTRRKKKHFDPIAAAVEAIVNDTQLLCFDEFHVTDITNAMLLGRLFEQLFEQGVVVVATSNVVPDRLYYHGLNRQLFLPFIALLKARCEVVHLAAKTDYRLDKLSAQPVFHFGTGPAVSAAIDQQWASLVGGKMSVSDTLKVLGREIVVPQAGMGCARFGFADLCEVPLGSRDYLALSQAYHTLVIEGVPQFDKSSSNGAKRFIQLIDTLYDRGTKLVASFDVGLDELSKDQDTGFEFKRTVSRLHEMASVDYLGGAGRK